MMSEYRKTVKCSHCGQEQELRMAAFGSRGGTASAAEPHQIIRCGNKDCRKAFDVIDSPPILGDPVLLSGRGSE
jgi:hypothetical protein